MKPHGSPAHHVGRPSRWPAPARGDFWFASASDRAQARGDAYAEAQSGSQSRDRPIAGALGLPAPGYRLEAKGLFVGYSTL
jgi:hypothetical protein